MGKTLDLTSTGDGTPAEKKPSYTQTQTAYKNPAYETDYGGTSKNTTVVNDDAQVGEDLPGKSVTSVSVDLEDTEDDEGQEVTTSPEDEGCIRRLQITLGDFWEKYGEFIVWSVYALFIAGYAVFFAYALTYEFGSESSVRLLWMTLLVAFILLVWLLRDYYGYEIYWNCLRPMADFFDRHYLVSKWVFIAAVVLFIFFYILIFVAMDTPENLVGLSGYAVYIILFVIFSFSPGMIWWRPVLWGLGLQFFFALLVLRTYWGYEAFKWLGDRVQEYMEYSDAGAEFVFGEDYEDHYFAFKVMPVVIFFSCTISILYHWGTMQAIIDKIAWLMQYTMGTTAAESTNAAGNIFIGQTEAPLLIKPMLNNMTASELHAVMVGGFATIAGSVMATYIMFGVPANHLITASVMAAPCALAMSKLFYPETDKSKVQTFQDLSFMNISPFRNTIEAAAAGASEATVLVANIMANLIAFIALLEFVNTTLTWCGHRVGLWAPEYPELTFELICSYVLWPFAFLMGVAVDDCRKVAELIGIKTFLNEFVAYTELGIIIDNSKYFATYNGTYEEGWDYIYLVDDNVTLYGGVMEERSIVISTYALCGFANISSIGMVIGALGGLAPQRGKEISSMGVRAMIAGNVVSFMNACIAGLFFEEGNNEF